MILEQSYRLGLPVPKRIAGAPSLMPGLDVYYSAFLDLCTERQVGWGEGPIPGAAIDDYIEKRFYFDKDDPDFDGAERMRALVRLLDIEYLKYKASKKPKPT